LTLLGKQQRESGFFQRSDFGKLRQASASSKECDRDFLIRGGDENNLNYQCGDRFLKPEKLSDHLNK
jgi:hypothetical protein